VVIFEQTAILELAIVTLVVMGVRSPLSRWSDTDLAAH